MTISKEVVSRLMSAIKSHGQKHVQDDAIVIAFSDLSLAGEVKGKKIVDPYVTTKILGLNTLISSSGEVFIELSEEEIRAPENQKYIDAVEAYLVWRLDTIDSIGA